MFELLGLLILRGMLRPSSHLWALLKNKAIRKAHTHTQKKHTSILVKRPTVLAQAAPQLEFESRDVCDLDSSMLQLHFFWQLRRNAESSVYGRAEAVLLCTEPKLRLERGRVLDTAPGLDQLGAGSEKRPTFRKLA